MRTNDLAGGAMVGIMTKTLNSNHILMKVKSEDILLQPATPAQAVAAAPLLFDTDPHLFAAFFGNDRDLALRFFTAQWQQVQTLFSHRYCTAALVRSDLVGIELGYDRMTQEAAGRGTAQHVAEVLTPDELSHFMKVVRYTPYLMPPTPEDTYYILHLAAAPAVRGMGVGALLLENACERAKGNGYSFCQLDVASDNPAVRFYLRMGMQILSESRVVPLQEQYGVQSHYRMVKAL